MTRAFATGLLGALMGVAAAAFDLPSLFVPGLALVALAAGASAWVELGARGVRIERAPGPPTVVEGEPYELTIDLRFGRVPPPPAVLIVRSVLERSVPAGVRGIRHVGAVIRFDRRGPRVVERARLVLRDPLGLAERSVEADPATVLVLPRVEPLRLSDRGRATGAGGERLDGAAAELELDTLRPYRAGTPAARIHWPTFARTTEMMERRLVADAESRPLIVLDASLPESVEALDRAVRAAASLCAGLASAGGCAILLPGDRRPTAVGPDLRNWPAVHARLARVEPGLRPPPLPRVTGRVALFWVTARHDRQAAQSRAVSVERYLVAPEPGRRPGALLSVAGCGVRRLTPASGRAA